MRKWKGIVLRQINMYTTPIMRMPISNVECVSIFQDLYMSRSNFFVSEIESRWLILPYANSKSKYLVFLDPV